MRNAYIHNFMDISHVVVVVVVVVDSSVDLSEHPRSLTSVLMVISRQNILNKTHSYTVLITDHKTIYASKDYIRKRGCLSDT